MTVHRHRQHRVEPEPRFRPWDPPYREIQRKIGVELRELFELPKEIPHYLLAMLMQLNDQRGDE